MDQPRRMLRPSEMDTPTAEVLEAALAFVTDIESALGAEACAQPDCPFCNLRSAVHRYSIAYLRQHAPQELAEFIKERRAADDRQN